MALNFTKLNIKTPKSVTLGKIKVLKNTISKPYNFSKFTKTVKLPKAKKVTAIKKAIKKNVGY